MPFLLIIAALLSSQSGCVPGPSVAIDADNPWEPEERELGLCKDQHGNLSPEIWDLNDGHLAFSRSSRTQEATSF